ncbi:hypothetical protein ACIQBJ_04715 [Kitasatospora sp. NPDC088391]|uniref:hypothetical protein n=1 Tax=Kitasatospora sp. NPDC088391 TaxID=3364074 RepID=UPI0038293340
MNSRQPLAARALLAAAALTATLALTACDPEGAGDDAATGAAPTAATSAPASPGAQSPATKPPASPAAGGKRSLVDAKTAGGLPRATGTQQLSDVPVDPGEMRDSMRLIEANFQHPGKTSARPVLFAGVDNVPEEPSKRREHLWRGLVDYALGEGSTGTPGTSAPYPAGPLGGNLECFPLGADALCGWVDTSTAAVALFPATAPADAAKLFAAMRADLEH